MRETPLDSDYCVSNLLDGEFLQIPDARVDPRLASHPLVTGEPHLRFYAGALLKTAEGFPIGMLCVLDYEPRRLDAAQEQALRLLARQTMAALELRRAAKSAEAERALWGAVQRDRRWLRRTRSSATGISRRDAGADQAVPDRDAGRESAATGGGVTGGFYWRGTICGGVTHAAVGMM